MAVELHHVIVTDRQLNEITASCLRRILNDMFDDEATRKTAGQDVLETAYHNKERMTVVLAMCNARKL